VRLVGALDAVQCHLTWRVAGARSKTEANKLGIRLACSMQESCQRKVNKKVTSQVDVGGDLILSDDVYC
jgi:hypothetical protein